MPLEKVSKSGLTIFSAKLIIGVYAIDEKSLALTDLYEICELFAHLTAIKPASYYLEAGG
jgi:hypothetical protein